MQCECIKHVLLIASSALSSFSYRSFALVPFDLLNFVLMSKCTYILYIVEII